MLIIAENVGDEALAALVVNKLRGPLQVAVVRAPRVGDRRKSILHDIALVTGGKVIAEGIHVQLNHVSELGQAKKITVDKNNTVIEFMTSSSHNCVPTTPHTGEGSLG